MKRTPNRRRSCLLSFCQLESRVVLAANPIIGPLELQSSGHEINFADFTRFDHGIEAAEGWEGSQATFIEDLGFGFGPSQEMRFVPDVEWTGIDETGLPIEHNLIEAIETRSPRDVWRNDGAFVDSGPWENEIYHGYAWFNEFSRFEGRSSVTFEPPFELWDHSFVWDHHSIDHLVGAPDLGAADLGPIFNEPAPIEVLIPIEEVLPSSRPELAFGQISQKPLPPEALFPEPETASWQELTTPNLDQIFEDIIVEFSQSNSLPIEFVESNRAPEPTPTVRLDTRTPQSTFEEFGPANAIDVGSVGEFVSPRVLGAINEVESAKVSLSSTEIRDTGSEADVNPVSNQVAWQVSTIESDGDRTAIAEEWSGELMTPRIRQLGLDVLESELGRQLIGQGLESPKVVSSQYVVDSIEIEFASRDNSAGDLTARTLAGISSAATLNHEFLVAENNIPLDVGVPIDPLTELVAFNIFESIADTPIADDVAEVTTHFRWAWTVAAASVVSSIGWLVIKRRAKSVDQMTEDRSFTNAYDVTVRATVQWT